MSIPSLSNQYFCLEIIPGNMSTMQQIYQPLTEILKTYKLIVMEKISSYDNTIAFKRASINSISSYLFAYTYH